MDKELVKKLEENGKLMRVRTGITDLLESSLSIIEESLNGKNKRPILRSNKEYEFIEILAR